MLRAATADDPTIADDVLLLLGDPAARRPWGARTGEWTGALEHPGPETVTLPTDPVVPARRCPRCARTFAADVFFCPEHGEVLVSNPHALVGTVFDRMYDIEDVVGEGGMGTVYRARHRLLRDVVALKLLRGDERKHPQWRRRFLREGRAARRFRHANSVTVYDLRTARDGTTYLVLEYVHGETLRSVLVREGWIELRDAVHILAAVASALDAAHAAGVVHRDLKPENVMRSFDGSAVKLLDLGIAGFLKEGPGADATAKLTLAGTYLGTPRYMSPEQWGAAQRDGIPDIDGRTDVYSLGVVAWEMLCGQPPFCGVRGPDLQRMHVEVAPADPRSLNGSIPTPVALAILKAMAKDRSDRYPTCGAFARELAGAVGESVATWPNLTSTADRSENSHELTLGLPQYGATAERDVTTGTGAERTVSDPATNLPDDMTSFVGRHATVGAVLAALRDRRLVSLVGPGGIGKTRLATQAGRQALEMFPDGVWFVDLSGLPDATLVASSVNLVIGGADSPDVPPDEAAIEAAGSRALLIILDNCEHLRPGCAAFASELLSRCPRVRILATSREPLGLAAETLADVSPLETPQPDVPGDRLVEACGASEAVRLFVDRARNVRPDFALTAQNAESVVALCRALDGVPLALELAAARTGVMTPAQIVARLERGLELLASNRFGAPDRHRTLRASIEWSVRLLPEPLQELFARLSVFRGGWTLEAAESVLARHAAGHGVEVVSALESLRAASLIVAAEEKNEMRFRMLETIRSFAAGLLHADAAEEARAAHARYFREFAETADAALAGPDQRIWIDRIQADGANIRLALEWGRQAGQPDNDLAVAAALGRFWTVRARLTEGLSALRAALDAAPAAPPELRGRALNWLGNLLSVAGDLDAAQSAHERALELRRHIGDPAGIAVSLHNLGGLAADRCDFARADELYDECTRIATALGDRLRLGQALVNRGRAACERGRYSQAYELLDRGIEMLEAVGHTYGVCIGLLCLGDAEQCAGRLDRAARRFETCLAKAESIGEQTAGGFALCGLGTVARCRGDLAAATAYAERAAALARDVGADDLLATSLATLGEVAVARGDAAEADSLFRQGLRIRAERGMHSGTALCLEGLAQAALAGGEAERAARFLGAASALRATIGVPVAAIDEPGIRDATARIRASLGDEAFHAAWCSGAELPISDLREGDIV